MGPRVVSPRSQSIFVQFAAFKFLRDTDEFGPASRAARRPRRAWKSLLTTKPFPFITRRASCQQHTKKMLVAPPPGDVINHPNKFDHRSPCGGENEGRVGWWEKAGDGSSSPGTFDPSPLTFGCFSHRRTSVETNRARLASQ